MTPEQTTVITTTAGATSVALYSDPQNALWVMLGAFFGGIFGLKLKEVTGSKDVYFRWLLSVGFALVFAPTVYLYKPEIPVTIGAMLAVGAVLALVSLLVKLDHIKKLLRL